LRAAEAVTAGHDVFGVEQADMSRWHNHYPDGHAFFCTYSVRHWSHRLDDRAVTVLYDEWEKASTALDVRILAYCIMPNHVHIVIWSESGENARKFLHRTIAQTSRRLRPGGGFLPEHSRGGFPHSAHH
jgi:REP element-mobilizing transposase RayT